ncbi:MAG TPA: PfkB family carbohydrate kinase [Ramlibacter sp.]|nr:PfkB family carbohydrate kinase [Ramlibacter sp.]
MENPETGVQVATAGEALMDLVAGADGRLAPCEGGAVYNFTRALALQGVGTAYLNPLSRDGFGRRLARGLAAAGVELACALPVEEPTSLALVSVDEHGHPAYGFYRGAVADRAIDAPALCSAMEKFPALQVVCTGCLALAPEDQARYQPWLRAAREKGVAVVVDANLRPAAVNNLPAYRASVLAALALADVIKASDEDLAALMPQHADPLQAARSLFALGPVRIVAFTRGREGALLLARDGRAWQARDSAPLRIADTVGAGDSFLAGLVAGLLASGGFTAGEPLSGAAAEGALTRAVASASFCVQQHGCVPPDAASVRAALAGGSIVVEPVPLTPPPMNA